MTLNDIKAIFYAECLKHTSDIPKINELYHTIEQAYKDRYFHNLYHLKNMFEKLLEVKGHIQDWNSIVFSVFYHDIIYDPTSLINEENSAFLAVEELKKIGVQEEQLNKIKQQILSTGSHTNPTSLSDIDYLIDADFCLLGSPWIIYDSNGYLIRQEFELLSDIDWSKGRKKFLKGLLNRDSIFLTKHFMNNYENKAIENITRDLTNLMKI